jgi:hypothetical protein
MRDVIAGCITNYNFEQIKPWVNSLDRSGFTGLKVMICYNIPFSVASELAERKYTILAFGKNEEKEMLHYSDQPFNICLERFFHMWYFFSKMREKEQFRYLISTDVKDVIFQKNPSEWLEKHMGNKLINVASESIRYRDEEWGNNNLKESFGSVIHSNFNQNEIYNAGTVSGDFDTLIDLFLTIYLSCGASPKFVPGGGGPDQSALNVLLQTSAYKNITRFTKSEEGWAAQLGTTKDPNKIEKYKKFLLEAEPVLINDVVCTSQGEPFYIVHQYDRVSDWKKIIEEKFQ